MEIFARQKPFGLTNDFRLQAMGGKFGEDDSRSL